MESTRHINATYKLGWEGHIRALYIYIALILTGKTSGLLGYWDDNSDKEYLLPNNKYLNTASTMSEIHHTFGQQCRFGIINLNHGTYTCKKRVEYFVTTL